MKKQKQKNIAYLASVMMGLGHQRAAYPLKDFAVGNKLFSADDPAIISRKELLLWEESRKMYEVVSRITDFPLLGKKIFDIYDRLQSIAPFYPFRDLSHPSLQSKFTEKFIKKGLGKGVFDIFKDRSKPVVSTFFAISLAGNMLGREKNFCIATDTDIARVWVANSSKDSNIIYFAPTDHVRIRLLEYGVSNHKIHFTGFPLPLENIGEKKEILYSDLSKRIRVLDPKNNFLEKYNLHLSRHLKDQIRKIRKPKRPLTLLFAVGGAGAQKEIGLEAMKSLQENIKRGEIRLWFSAGAKREVRDYFEVHAKKMDLETKVAFSEDLDSYFRIFNQMLRETDILWTKPSELSFYAGLGIPILMAPPIGSQEKFNRKWVIEKGCGVDSEDPKYTNEWLFEWIQKGYFAEWAWQGYLDAPTRGTKNIVEILEKA